MVISVLLLQSNTSTFFLLLLLALVIAVMKSYELMSTRGKSLKQQDVENYFGLYMLQVFFLHSFFFSEDFCLFCRNRYSIWLTEVAMVKLQQIWALFLFHLANIVCLLLFDNKSELFLLQQHKIWFFH